MTKYLKIKNWENFQHYKDRSPPWIKLHRDLLRDYDFICLQDASKLHLMLIWLLASQLDNKIPADENFIKNQIGVKDKIDFNELIDKGFLVDDSGSLASCKQSAMPETETETETETDYTSLFSEFFEVYPKRDGSNPKKPALDKFIKACKKTDPGEIINAAKKYAMQEKRKGNIGTSYIAQAQTWLNQERWKDEYDTGKTKRKNYIGM